MRKSRIVTDDLINRVHRAEEVVRKWMTSNNIVETTPELCMEVLVERSIYEYDSNGRGHHYREDLRTLRDNDMLDTTFERIAVKQRITGTPWFIVAGK